MLTGIFSAVLTMSATASIAILCVLLGRLLLRRAPKIFSYVLWAVVLFRLLCPVSLPAAFSLFSLVPVPAAATGQVEHLPQTLPSENDPAVSSPLSAEGQESLPQSTPVEGLSPAKGPVSLRSAGAVLWLGGVGAMAAYGLVKLMRLHRKLVGAIPLEGAVFLADHIPTSFVLGVFRPRIYLPSALLPEESSYIIAHERHHIARGDHITRILAYAALCLHWFNPLVWLAFLLSGRDMEMSCDEAVMGKTGRDIRAEYSTSLLQLSTNRRLMPLAFGQGDIKERIENIMQYKKPACLVTVVAVALCFTLTACLSTDPAPDADQPSQDSGQPVSVENASLPELSSDADPEMQSQLFDSLSTLFDTAYSPYYEGLRYEISDYQDLRTGDDYTAAFFWTMYNLDNGGDIPADTGRQAQSCYSLLATGKIADGKLTSVTVMADTSLKGPAQYTQPLASLFPGADTTLTLTGYITALDPSARTVAFDQVFWLTSLENDDLMDELGLMEEEMPSGSNDFFIYNPETDTHTYPISPQATQQIFDAPEDGPWHLVDTDLATFARELNTRTPIYILTVKNGEVTQLSERYVP